MFIKAEPQEIDDEKYALAAKELHLSDIHSFLRRTKLDLEPRVKMWTEDYVSVDGSVAIKLERPPNVTVDIKDSGKLFAALECVLCHKDIGLGFKKFWTKNNLKCIFDRCNFKKHMQHHHKNYVFNKN